MSLSDKANVSGELRRVVNNAFYEHHPFKRSSGQMEDFVRSFHEIRQLPPEDFSLCFEAIHEVVVRNSDCDGCYGKGLAYLKLLTQGIDETRHDTVNREFESFASEEDDLVLHFEQDVLAIMRRNGVNL